MENQVTWFKPICQRRKKEGNGGYRALIFRAYFSIRLVVFLSQPFSLGVVLDLNSGGFLKDTGNQIQNNSTVIKAIAQHGRTFHVKDS